MTIFKTRLTKTLSNLIGRAQTLSRRARLAGIMALSLLSALGLLYWQVDTRAQVDDARPADTIIVLGCAVWPGGRPSPALAARTRHAIALYKSGLASHLILTGGIGNNPPAEAEVMRSMAVAAGVPSQALILETDSHSTEASLANSKHLMDERGWTSALIVSDPFHLYRADLMARDLGIDAHGSPASDSPTYTAPQLRLYYTTREALGVVWYYAVRTVGEPTWLYRLLKGRV